MEKRKGSDDLISAGQDILDSVNYALKSGDYSKLTSDITKTVNQATRQVASSVSASMQEAAGQMGQASGTARDNASRVFGNSDFRTEVNRVFGGVSDRRNNFSARDVSQMTGLGKQILGWSGFGLFALLSLGSFALMFIPVLRMAGLMSGFGFAAAAAAFCRMALLGAKDHKLADTYRRYGNLIQDKEVISIRDLARLAGQTEDEVKVNLKKMRENDYLPLVHFDRDMSTIILTDQAYKQYLDWERERDQRREQEANMSPAEREILELTQEGENYIREVRAANDRISDHAMTAKLDRLEQIMRNIFENVKKHPESARDIRRMIDFYLPTIQKLLDAYIELDSQSGHLDNVKRTKAQIEDSMDIINDAFEKLLNDLFQNVLFDVSSDISVMETMMRQDGLSGKSIRDYESGLSFGSGATASAAGPGQTQTAAVEAPFGDRDYASALAGSAQKEEN